MLVPRNCTVNARAPAHSTSLEICVQDGDNSVSESLSRVGICVPWQKLRRFFVAIVITVMCTCLSVMPSLAHVSFEEGPYHVVVGWVNEPVIVGERNGITVSVSEDGVPVNGQATSLEIAIQYAGRTFLGNLTTTDVSGVYEVEIYPTVQGQYEVQVTGLIGNTKVDKTVEPEEVLPGKVLQFPETQPTPRELQLFIVDLENRIRKTYVLVAASSILSLLAIGGLVFIYFRRQS